MRQLPWVYCLATMLSWGIEVSAQDLVGKEVGDIGYLELATDSNPSAENRTVPSGAKPVYRFYNTVAGGHFFTISEEEKNYVQENLPQYQYEGIGFYAYDGSDDDSPTPATPTTPHAGSWSGSIVSFNVGSDGQSLTSSGSPLMVNNSPASLVVLVEGTSCQNVRIGTNATISITNNAFSKSGSFSDGSSYSVAGSFSSSTSANGSYRYTGVGSECSGDGNWTTNYQ